MVVKVFTMFELSRALFQLNEVKWMIEYGFMNGIEDKKELFFWINEYYHSVVDKERIWKILYESYFMFYALEDPQFFHYMNTKYTQFHKNPSFLIVLDVAKNLFDIKYLSYNGFYAHYEAINCPKKMKTYKRPMSLWKKINEFLSQEKESDLYALLFSQDPEVIKKVCRIVETSYPEYSFIPKSEKDTYDCSVIKVFISLLRKHKKLDYEEKSDHPKLYRKVTLKESKEVQGWNNVFKKERNDKILKEYVKYSIFQPFTLCFKENARYEYPQYRDEVWYHWLKHANTGGIWKSRVESYSSYDPKREMLYFKNDDDIESFGEKYELEIDEQPLWIQDAYGLYNEKKTYTSKEFLDSKKYCKMYLA